MDFVFSITHHSKSIGPMHATLVWMSFHFLFLSLKSHQLELWVSENKNKKKKKMVFLSYRNRVMVANWWPHGQSIVTSHFRLYSPMNSSNLFSDQPHFSYTSHFTFFFFNSQAPALHSIPTNLFLPIPIKNIHSKVDILKTRKYHAIDSSNYKAAWYFK